MKKITHIYSNPKQAVLPILIQDYLDICDPVLTFDRFMGEIDLEKYLKEIPKHEVGRLRYNPVSMLKTILFGFMTNGYVSLRELEDSCKVNLRFMYLMDHEVPSYRTFGYFINEILSDSIEKLFCDINQKIFEKEHTDLQHLYIDSSKFEANANKYSWVWKKATEKSRYRLFEFHDIYGFYPKYPVADAGYGSYNNYIFCEQNGLEKYMKFPMFKKETTDRNYHEDPFRAVNFKIDGDGKMRCPNGKGFHLQYRKAIKGNAYGREEEIYQCEDCSGCPYAEKCKKGEGNRTVRVNQELTKMHQEVIENLESIQGALLRMNRSIQAEGTFGIIKNDRWYKRIVRRGIKSVQLEVYLVSLGHNLYKFHNKQMKIKSAA